MTQMETKTSETRTSTGQVSTKLRPITILLSLIILIGFLAFRIEITFPGASLQVLVDRNLQEQMIAANRVNPDLQRSNVDGSGHNYWVDTESGFTIQDQTDLIEFLLSLDDNPEVLTASSR